MAISIYSPRITHAPIYYPRNGPKPYLRYNHDIDIVHFQNRFIAAWNANTTGEEDVPGQYNYISYSNDFTNWSPAEKMFSDKHCLRPVLSDNQWQPSFINWKDKRLFCFWCDFNDRKTYVSFSNDGDMWDYQEIASPVIDGIQTVAFPTNHGLITSGDMMVCPVNFVPVSGLGGVSGCRCAGAIISTNGGKEWHCSGYAEAIAWEEIGCAPTSSEEPQPRIWEPMIFEEKDGSLGMLIRNEANLTQFSNLKAEHMLLYSNSKDSGKTWSLCRPTEIETVASRCFAMGHNDSLFMVMNDWSSSDAKEQEQRDDRINLSLYVAPESNVDCLLPGPLVQLPYDRGYYPNGFIANNKMYLAYSYPDILSGCVVHDLPDFSKPFLLPRESRGATIFNEDAFSLLNPAATVGLIPTPEQQQADTLCIEFEFFSKYRDESEFPILTLGGKSKNGASLSLVFNEETEKDDILVRLTNNLEMIIGSVEIKESACLKFKLSRDKFTVICNDKEFEFSEILLRKIAFGGLYMRPEWERRLKSIQNEICFPTDKINIFVN